MSVRQRPMGIPANPTAAPFEVVPMMTYKEGCDDFTQEARRQTVFSGAEIAVAVGRKPSGNPFGFARGDHIEYRSRRNGAGHLCENVGKNVGALEAASGLEPNGNRTIEMPAGDVADRIRHGQYGQSEG
jgi:hypothetical protein